MKKYESEKVFTEMFAKHVNEGETTFEVNGEVFTVSGKSKNSSNAAVYAVNINGQNKAVTIMQLKKLLNVTYKKEYNRTNERATSVGTKVVIKTDEELMKTAVAVEDRCKKAMEVLTRYANQYCFDISMFIAGGYQDDDKWITVSEAVFEDLKKNRDIEIAEQQAREEKAAAEKAAKVESVSELMGQLHKAMADGDLTKVAEISAKISKAAK